MRISEKVLLSCAAVAAAGLLSAPAAMANGDYCTSFNPGVTVVGPCPVLSASPNQCEDAASVTGFTGVQYSVTGITGSPDIFAALVTANNTVVSAATQISAPCQGDRYTDLGERSCHEQAVSFYRPNATTFWIVVKDRKAAVPLSVAVGKGYCVKSFPVAGLGYDVSPFQVTQKNETVNFKGCAVTFVRDPLTGTVTNAYLDPSSTLPSCESNNNTSPCCSPLITTDVGKLKLSLDPTFCSSLSLPTCALGAGQFGDGYVSSGTGSCTTRVIGGRVYTWGTPCP